MLDKKQRTMKYIVEAQKSLYSNDIITVKPTPYKVLDYRLCFGFNVEVAVEMGFN